ncbi:S8 family serine peptidase [Coleofasciculus sp. G2-EDA-02]|uniref:S8 family serine peptidase n=1 Tax=Coleofasciculus sp. G2-EDA-02 TaxID=3069529 RepID=UPI0032FD7F3A
MSVNDDLLDLSENSQIELNGSVDVEDESTDQGESTNQVAVAPKREMESPEIQALVQELSSTMGVEGTDYHPGEVIIKFNPSIASTNQINALQTSLGANVKESTQNLGIQLWQIQGMSVAEAIALYSNDPAVEYIEPNYIVSTNTTVPNDPQFNQLWGLNNTGQTGGTADADIDAPEAWDIETGNNIVVGVIDTGVDYNHPDLNDNMWINPGEIAGNGIDDDGNGYVDDVYGWDFINNDNNPFDDNSHGTHVAGTIAAEGNNGIGVTGVSWSANIMALKFLGASGSGSTFNAIQAVEYATMMGANLTNNSWGGGGFSQGLYDAIAAAGAAGQLFIAAAGNTGGNTDFSPHYPASYNLNNIISVANTNHNDQLSGTSSYGLNSVDLGAPGSSVYSTIPGGGYGFKSGTSMASPHVAGVASLIWSQDPTLTAQQVKDRILATVDPIPALQGITVSGGRLNAYSALTGSTLPPVVPVIFDDFDPDIDNSQWSTITNGTANSNLVGSDGNSLWFNGGSAGGSSRFAITNLVDVANGGTITFDLIFGNGSNGGENADPGEDVVLEYSTNGGTTWNQFGLYDTEAFTTWTTLTETIPTAAQTSSTNFRWRQIAHSGNSFDNWAIDNVTVGAPILNSVVDDFDPDIDNSQWSTITNGTANSNFVGSDGNSLWFNGGASGGNSRLATTNFVDVSSGGTVFFDLIFGNGSNGGENADAGEDVVLEYSINGGSSWTQLGLYDTEAFTSWTTLSETIPTAAQTSSTSFRWRQVNHSGNGFDNWAIDNVFVGVPQPAEISGSKWNDLNGDGKQDANEPGLAGWTIYLDNNQNGQLDPGETSTKTDINGDYTFTNLNPGSYTVAEVLRPGWKQTFPSVNGGFETGSFDPWQTTGNTTIETAAFGSGPTEGTNQALLTNGGTSVSDTQLETFLGLTSGSLDGLGNGNATVGSAIKQTVTVSAGTQLSFDWNFLTNEATPTFFNDFGFVSIVSNTLNTLANTNSSFVSSPTIFNEETGFGTFSYTFQTAGTFTLGIGVVDVGDTVVDSGLLVDNLSFTGNSFPIGGSQKVTLGSGDIVTNIDFGNQKIPPKTIFGTSGDDVFTITDSPVIVFALAGNDEVDGSGSVGGNQFYGGKGNDTLIGNSYDQLFGEAGDDRLDVSNGGGNNLLDGGKGKDELLANFNDQLFGGQGHDTLDASSGGGNNLLDGGNGDDVLIAGSNDHLLGGKGEDILDVSSGGSHNVLDGGQGDDILNALNGGGNNLLDGGQGDDILIAGSNDQLLGGDGDDILNASVGTGNNSLDGGDGDDNLLAGFNDQLFGGDGDDILNASFGSGNNSLDGGKGDDILIAGFNDQLSGGDGDDLLFGGDGGSTMTGGNGEEQFWIVNGFVPSAAHTITDFELEIDRIGIRGLGITFQQLDLIQDGNDTRISVFNTDLAILSGIQANALDRSDFILA